VSVSAVSVSDPLTGLNSTITSLAPGEEETYTATYTITQADLNSGSVTNTVTVTGLGPDSTPVSAESSVTVNALKPPAAANDVSSDNIPGSAVTVNILENDKLEDGSPALPDLVIVDIDPLTDGIQTELTIEGEGTWTFDEETGMVTFTPLPTFYSDPAPLVYRLSAKETPGLFAEATVFIYVDQETLVSTVSLVKRGEYNPSNGTILYAFEVINTGEIPLRDIEIDDERIGITGLGVVPDTLVPGSTGTATATYKISQADIDAGGVTNSAKVRSFNSRGESVEDDSGTELDNDEPTVTVFEQNPSVYIEKEAVLSTDEVALGDVVNFSISVENTGNISLFNVLVEDPLTGFEQESDQLLPGESLNFMTEYTVQTADETEGEFVNVAMVSAGTLSGSQVEASSAVTVQVAQCELVIPTGFSPNGDGIQDTWRIKCLENYPDARVEIYNRWGNLVFEKDNFGNSDIHGAADEWWDGYSSQKWSFGNDKLPAGTYFYILDLKDGSEPLKGYLFLNR
jgi:gliding motility-associated-like protein